jgi:hypothetical protein
MAHLQTPSRGNRALGVTPPGTPTQGINRLLTVPRTPSRQESLLDQNIPTTPTSTMANLRLTPGSGHRTPHRTPDRFIPTLVNASSFRMGAPTSELTPDERLMRRYVTGAATRNRSISPTRRPRGGEPPRPNRRLSAGGVGMFAVGIPAGLAPDNATPTTPRQRGREIDGNIFSNRRSPERERQAHESRLSAALGIDRAQRVFHYGPERDMVPVSPRADRFGRGGIPGSPGMVPNHRDELWDSTLAGQNGKLTLRNLIL